MITARQEAFDGPLRKGGPVYIPKSSTPITTAIDMIRAAGGIAVFAHPFARRRGSCVEPSVIRELAAAGLGGIEVDHPDHCVEDREALRALAAAEDLLVTGSSDYHGSNKTTRLAACRTDPQVLDALVERTSGAEILAG